MRNRILIQSKFQMFLVDFGFSFFAGKGETPQDSKIIPQQVWSTYSPPSLDFSWWTSAAERC